MFIKSFSLISNTSIPAIGLGTWKGTESEIYSAVKCAIDFGYRHIDAAAIYGNEGGIGQAMEELLLQKKIKREDVFITSKLWNSYHLPKDVLPAIKNSLANLKLDYLDLFLVHWPVAFKPETGLSMPKKGSDYLPLAQAPLMETWQAMEKLVELGLAKSIGVSNFSKKQLLEIILHARIPISVNQVECHPYLSQENLIQFCHKNNIHVTAYSPLGSADRPADLKALGEPSILENETILDIARKHGATAAQIALAWQLARGVSVIPKSVRPDRIKQNLVSLEINLSEEDIKKINGLNLNHRYLDGSFWTGSGSPYKIMHFWDDTEL